MASIQTKRFESPDEVRHFEGKGRVDVVNVADRVVGRGTFEPGWTWANNVKPIAGTDRCEVSHLGFCLSGHMRITMIDGTTQDIDPGDAFAIHAGHDAEVIGNIPCTLLDFGEIEKYARR